MQGIFSSILGCVRLLMRMRPVTDAWHQEARTVALHHHDIMS